MGPALDERAPIETRAAHTEERATTAPAHWREFVGDSEGMTQLRRMALKVAPKGATVLINGESGTGKEVLARFIHAHSTRSHRPFVAINCAAIPESLVESELFGHEKGAFTGAVSARRGCFEEAHGGTLFLDEVTEIRPHVQAKLLRALQESEIRPVGGTRTRRVNVRILAASSRHLPTALRDGVLRDDLYYRLATVEMAIPPLRARAVDLRPLCRHFLAKHAAANGSALRDVADEALAVLAAYGWPGNVRELENVVARATVLAPPEDGAEILPAHLPQAVRGQPAPCARPPVCVVSHAEGGAPADDDSVLDLRAALAQLRRDYAEEALRRTRGNKAEAARLLGVSRRGLYNLLGGVDDRPDIVPVRPAGSTAAA